jgi:amidohydrolase
LTRGFPKPDFALGSHAVPLATGVAVNAPGVRMAGTDQLDVTFTGVGGHGSTPNLAIDPVVMAAQAVMAYQTIISRSVDPKASAVVTVGALLAGRDNNVIPASAELRINLRWFDADVRGQILKRIDEINKGIVIGAGLGEDKVPVREMKGTAGPLRNDAALVAAVNPALSLLLGDGKVIDQFPAVMGSEDFQEAFAKAGTPYNFILIGIAAPERAAAAAKAGRPFPFANHNNDFAVDLPAIPLGAKIDTVAALTLLGK